MLDEVIILQGDSLKFLGYVQQRIILVTQFLQHAFGGIAPVLGAWQVPHRTPVEGLWFVGAQSESGGGVNNVMPGAYKTARRIAGALARRGFDEEIVEELRGRARDALLVEGARVFGMTVRGLHPPEAARGLEHSAEYAQHFAASYRPLILRALENRQPVLARLGRGEFGNHHPIWGAIEDSSDGGVGSVRGGGRPAERPADSDAAGFGSRGASAGGGAAGASGHSGVSSSPSRPVATAGWSCRARLTSTGLPSMASRDFLMAFTSNGKSTHTNSFPAKVIAVIDGDTIEVDRMGAGTYFGEMALLTGEHVRLVREVYQGVTGSFLREEAKPGDEVDLDAIGAGLDEVVGTGQFEFYVYAGYTTAPVGGEIAELEARRERAAALRDIDGYLDEIHKYAIKGTEYTVTKLFRAFPDR